MGQEKASTLELFDKENEEIPKEVEDIKAAMKSLFFKLDTLTHFHYTPKQKSAEVRIVRNVPSINMEEVAPTAASNADLLAPNEIVQKTKGELLGQDDKTTTDKKRERRQKKIKKKAALLEKARKEKERELSNPGTKSISKEKAMKNLEAAEKAGKLKTVKVKDKKSELKSSTAFFNVLEDQKNNKKEKSSKNKRLKGNGSVSLASLKL